MAAIRGPRLQVGSASWIADERASALQIAQTEVEEFSFSARNELDWLNEHMAGIFNENEINLAETFKTPGKLRGKTPRTARKANALEARVPLSDIFSTNSNAPSIIASQLNSTQSAQTHSQAAKTSPSPVKQTSAPKTTSPTKHTAPVSAIQDSGYYGSQDVRPVEIHMDLEPEDTRESPNHPSWRTTTTVPVRNSPSRAAAVVESPEKTFQTAREEQTTRVLADVTTKTGTPRPAGTHGERIGEDKHVHALPTSPTVAMHAAINTREKERQSRDAHTEQSSDDTRSPSDGSSPIRPMVRKSSLNFASLPAREPLTAGKSIGTRVSRTSHLDHIRTSYYSRPTGGKSLGNLAKLDHEEDEDRHEMDTDAEALARDAGERQNNVALSHTKTYTQRLQDQINMLGKSQSKGAGQSKPNSSAQPSQKHKAVAPKSPSPARKLIAKTTPGAFPEDDDDDWIDPPATEARPALPKSHSADVMEDIQGKDTIGQHDFALAKRRQDSDSSASGPTENITWAKGHAPFPSLQSPKRTVSVSNTSLPPVSETEGLDTPFKSPSRTFRESPLKQVKNKLSSILKSSKGLLASSAAVSAEGKSMMSPSTMRLDLHSAASSESIVPRPRAESHNSQTLASLPEGSPTRPVGRRTRASVEREKEEKRREKEAKRMEEQYEKLEKAREKEREKALVFSKEQEKIAAMEKQLASKKAEEKSMPKETPKPTRSSPRKVKAAEEGEQKPFDGDVEMEDAPSTVPPPSTHRSVGPGQAIRNTDIKRPVRPAKETQAKAKQAPTVIRVNTGSQHSQYHTSTRLSTASHDTAGPSSSQSQHQLVSKSSKASLHAKPSTNSVRNAASVARLRALDLAAKKKEQDEREAQRRRDARAEIERKRAAAQEEQRKQDQSRRQEAERQKQQYREHMATQNDGKTPAQRKAAIEKAKQTRAPPPAARPQPNGALDSAAAQDKTMSTASSARGVAPASRPQSRMTSNLHRSQGESNRPVNAVLSNTSKAGAKRTLDPERSDDNYAKRPPSRGGPAYQANDAKRRRTSDGFDDEAETDTARNIKGPPVRPSGGFKKDLPTKSMYGYANAPQSATRDLFKATVTAQHNSQVKAAHPLDMAQISKGAIPFAPNPNSAGAAHKTPARPGAYNGAKSAAKSAARSSPRFQNGESIELPEIQTDDEDEDEDEASGTSVAAWADSPDLRRALMRQETMDPSQIFGPPAPLNMEEVFNKSKDRWHKFRARTSSANWSGTDRLTEEDIRKDLAARDKLRREGGWSYELSRELM